MSRKIAIITKEEAYTYDELAFLEEKILPLVEDAQKVAVAEKCQQNSGEKERQKSDVGEILRILKASLENQKDSAAVFFMPQNTFNIFSLIQGDNSICKIGKENVAALYKALSVECLDSTNLIDDGEGRTILSHLRKKLQVLNEYLEQGNEVTPTVIAADNFSEMEIDD